MAYLVNDTFSTITFKDYSYTGSSPVILQNGAKFTIDWGVTNTTGTLPVPIIYKPGNAYQFTDLEEAWYDGMACNLEDRTRIKNNHEYHLPDGAKLIVDNSGNYRIEDKDAKVTYQANRIREFSPYLNASDLLAQFVKYVGSLGIRQSDVLNLPIELFINWLIIEAAERDKDPIPEDVVRVEQHQEVKLRQKPKCLLCQRYIPRLFIKHRFLFCNPQHAFRFLEKEKLQHNQRLLTTKG